MISFLKVSTTVFEGSGWPVFLFLRGKWKDDMIPLSLFCNSIMSSSVNLFRPGLDINPCAVFHAAGANAYTSIPSFESYELLLLDKVNCINRISKKRLI